MEFRPGIVIPVYNHKDTVERMIRALQPLKLPCFIVDDGSDEATRQILDSLPERYPELYLKRLPENRGKGAAVRAGLGLAHRHGCTHALQIDADGQHDIRDAPAFLETAEQTPRALITGQPLYDASAPRGRVIGRKITAFWVGIETLSLDMPDTMCGFRVYPLDSTHQLLRGTRLGQRMDFDTEILVRLVWKGVPVKSIPTRITYPEDGLSHFRYLHDNVLISLMHTRLVFGMLWRLPGLLYRKIRGGRRGDWRGGQHHWSEIGERGTVAGMRLLIGYYRLFGRTALNAVLTPVIVYYLLTHRQPRRASRQYLDRAYRAGARDKHLRKKPTQLSSFWHFFTFGQAVADKAASWAGDIGRDDIVFDKIGETEKLNEQKRGILIISAHLGNIEIGRAIADRMGHLKLNALVFTENARKYNTVLKQINPRAAEQLIHVNHVGPDTAIWLKQKIDNGEFVIILGDRTLDQSGGRVSHARFLGEPAPFGQGPFILAGLLECPVYLMFCLKRGSKYHINFEHFADIVHLPRQSREQTLQPLIQRYADRLQHYCMMAPYQWFNFYDFWQPPPQSASAGINERQ